MRKTCLLFCFLLIFPMSFATPTACSGQDNYLGIEVVGSRRFSREQLASLVNLKGSAGLERQLAAVKRLEQYFERQHVRANVQLVQQPQNQTAIVVDLTDAVGEPISRRLNGMRHVHISSEKPFILLANLHERLAVLADEGRANMIVPRDGLVFYNDEPANQMIQEIQQFLPAMKGELLEVADSDPDSNRRSQAIELLAWYRGSSDVPDSLVSALSDVNREVRLACTRYFYPRLDALASDFPYDGLIQGLSSMLGRPSHQDRSKSLYCLLKVCSACPQTIPQAKDLCGKQIDELVKMSILPTIKQTAGELKTLFDTGFAPGVAKEKNPTSEEPDF
jgi:hypothetical protein